jgi:putative ABC transport system ATP-binding protein
MELFRKVAHEKGAGVLVVTHDHRSLDVFDEILEMEDGTLRAHEQTSQGAHGVNHESHRSTQGGA